MSISNDEMEGLVDELDMEDFLGWISVDFKNTTGASGPQLNVKTCPRCGGSDWKVFINAETGFGNCFQGSCVGEPGYNKITFAAKQLGGFKEAFEEIRRYATAAGWRPPRKKVSIEARLRGDVKLPKSSPLPFSNSPIDIDEQLRAISYTAGRNISDETMRSLDWRYSSEGVFEYKDYQGESKSQYYAQRIVTPIFNLDGHLVTFQGRDITGSHPKKYLFPPGLQGTGRFLYNAHSVIESPTIVIGEGTFDVASILQAIREDTSWSEVGVVGSFGKSLSGNVFVASDDMGDQLTQLIRLKQSGLKDVVMMWDGEAKAIIDAIKACEMIKSIGLRPFLSVLPDGKDPNECTPSEVRQAFYDRTEMTKSNAFKAMLHYKRLASRQ